VSHARLGVARLELNSEAGGCNRESWERSTAGERGGGHG